MSLVVDINSDLDVNSYSATTLQELGLSNIGEFFLQVDILIPFLIILALVVFSISLIYILMCFINSK